jgi:cell division protease FtsH
VISGAPTKKPAPPRRSWVRTAIVIAAQLLLIFLVLGPLLHLNQAAPLDLPYSEFKAQVAADNVASVTLTGDAVTGSLKQAISYGGIPKTTTFQSQLPGYSDPGLATSLDEHHVVVSGAPVGIDWGALLIQALPLLLLIGFWVWLLRRSGSATQGIFSFGQSRARVQIPSTTPHTTFADVAGVDEAKAELQEIVEFLRSPQKFQRLGGRMPRGVLLVGPPGTGKTLLARAVAGEAGVPFFSISASEFVEMFVGVGAARVRSLFDEAKQHSPAVVFVDELDAVGRQRGTGLGGGHDEREQTLNQLLVEMDGFDESVGLVVLAASNRADILDPALLRPGRFDRRVVVDRPDRRGRLAILKVHCRKVPLGPNVDLDVVARSTPGLAGADLANLVNEAALRAARLGRNQVIMEDFEEAFDRIVLGAERKIVLSDAERRTIAYHEAGHALVAWMLPQADPVHKITIVPRGQSLGVTQSLPTGDQYNVSLEYLQARIASALGGRASEQLALGTITTGAQNDLQAATELARRMVTTWGMSRKLGLLSFDESAQAIFLGRELVTGSHVSQRTAALIDEEATRILTEGMNTAAAILAANRSKLDHLAEALVRDETLEENQIAPILGPRVVEAPVGSRLQSGAG